MVSFIEFVFFFYIFIGLYMLSLLVLIYWPNRMKLFDYPLGKAEPVSIVVPCYNASATIGKAIESLLELDYPKEMVEIIVVDDKSKDNSVEIVKGYVKKYRNVKLIESEVNSGGAAEPTNIGVRAAKNEYVVVADDDSTPDRDALIKMIGFLQEDRSVGGVTCAVMVRTPGTFMQKLQAIEYAVISWSRKLLDLVDAVYVTPGPFAVYRKNVLMEIGLFDKKNLTQDIEIVWKMQAHGYKARMCLATQVHSEAPTKFRAWFRQRIRWNIGGTQTLIKYRRMLFRKKMLGAFIIPFFSASLFIGLFGMGLFGYLLGRRLLVSYLSTKYSIYGSTAILRLEDLTFSPSVLNFFGGVMFIVGAMFTLFGLGVMKEIKRDYINIFNVSFYMIVYLTIYPVIMIVALWRMARGKYVW